MSVHVKGDKDPKSPHDFNHQPASFRWSTLDNAREVVMGTKRMCAALTLPYMLPPRGHTEGQRLATPYQGMGAQIVNNLSSKLSITLFSPNQKFFRLELPKAVIEDMESQGDTNIEAFIKKQMSDQEDIIQNYMERNGYRNPINQAMKMDIVVGDSLLHQPEGANPKVYRLDQYVVRRDQTGKVLEIILKQLISRETLNEAVQELIDQSEKQKTGNDTMEGSVMGVSDRATDTKNYVPVYTVIKRDGKFFKEHQELKCGTIIPDTEGDSPVDSPAWLASRWTAIPGEDYGRSLVEEYLGDLKSLEQLYRAMIKGTACMAKVVYLVRPSGMTNIKRLARANTGDFVTGNPDDVHALQTDKTADFNLAVNLRDNLEQRLAKAFLLTSSLGRDAERVTAEEIRLLAEEIESSLGGTYSILAEELQFPVLKRVMSLLTRRGDIKELPDKLVRPKIVSGIDGLGRGQTLKKFETLGNVMSVFPEIKEELDIAGLSEQVLAAIGLDSDGVLKSPEMKQQEAEAAQNQAMQSTMMEGAGKAIPGIAQEVMQNPENAAQVQEQIQENMPEV